MTTDSLVGRTPWSAARPQAGVAAVRKNRSRGTRADPGVRPTTKVFFW